MEMLGDNRIDDVRWLCSLSESELDLLVSLKQMAIRRASFIGHESLANKFDLKMLRGLSFVLTQTLKQKLGEVPLDRLNIVRHEISEDFREMSAEELMAYIGSDRKRRISELFGGDLVKGKKKKRGGPLD